MMSDFLIMAALVVVAAFFWQLRTMAELSRVMAEQACRKQNVQLLAVAMESASPSLGGHTGLCWKAKFMFEFSTDGINQYRAHIFMQGKTVKKIDWPIFPEPEWMDAPKSQGKFGGCGSRSSCSSGKCR
ncbi:DUF3301 domain-containing protein [Shewanella gaetbuli]|uniref:DUF3301 domain-containing protein n=1 Tax=Shewanella gaetbuli TaxID=220752 RepID=A0A9X1ZSL4_9GAMM|nr:DUF3301 domain-containing protein [Shewanella gaetbuli]MCL1143323.1 DUF3301 domain-containing protein [Shewanella gaetbuli]